MQVEISAALAGSSTDAFATAEQEGKTAFLVTKPTHVKVWCRKCQNIRAEAAKFHDQVGIEEEKSQHQYGHLKHGNSK